MSKLILPQCEIFYPKNILQEILFVAGGRRPDEDFFKKLSVGRKIFAIDKGIEICRDLNIFPEILIGDFDSADNSSLTWAKKNKIPIEKHPIDKDFTDTQLALNLVNEKNFLILTGIFGGRFDHLFSNVFTCANSKIRNCLVDEKELIFFVKSGENFSVKFNEMPKNLSLLPISELCEGVTIKNVHWELENFTLKQNFPNAISNRVENGEIKISVRSGTLAVYFNF
mgnify:CR=1 FL=1